MTHPQLWHLAQEGNVEAITQLINQQLQPSGVTATASLKESCLQLILESAQLADWEALVAFLRQEIISLGAASITTVHIYGRQLGNELPVWNQEFAIAEPESEPSYQVTEPTAMNLREQGKPSDLDAISILLNTALVAKNTTAKISLQDSCLTVILESEEVPEPTVATIVRREIMMLKPDYITSVKIYGKQIWALHPEWKQEFELSAATPTNSELKKQNITQLNKKESSSPNFKFNLRSITWILQGQILGVVGSLTLLLGVFMPNVTFTTIGNVNYFFNGLGNGLIVFGLALAALFFALRRKYQWLWWMGFISAGVIVLDFSSLSKQGSQIEWGWGLLIVGAVLILGAAVVGDKNQILQVGYIRYFANLFSFQSSSNAYIVVGIVAFLIFMTKLVGGFM